MRALVRLVPALMVAATLAVAGCGTVTYVLQEYGGEPRSADSVAIVRITSRDPLHVSSVDGDPLDVRLDPDTRVHVEMLPGEHVLGVYRPDAEIPIEQKVRFLASPGRTYAVVMAEAPPGSATPWTGRVYEIDRSSGTRIHDATR
jgi:hypothetical protein